MAGEGWRVLATPLIDVQAPATWPDVPRDERRGVGDVPAPDADAVAAMPGVVSGRFRPNVVVTSAPTDESIESISLRVLAETAAIPGWSRSLSCDLWTGAGAPARRHEFFYAVGSVVVLVTAHVLLVDRHRVDVTFSRAIEDAVPLTDVGAGVAASIRPRSAA